MRCPVLRPLLASALFVSTLLLPAFAQDEPPPPPPSGDREERAPRAPTRDVTFDPAPEGWQKAAPSANAGGRGRRRFLADYTLPAAEGQPEGPKVSVMSMGPREFDEYRSRLKNNWSKPDGTPLTDADQVVELRKAADPEVRVVEQSGSQTPRDGAKKDGLKLIAVYVRSGDDRWSVWLLGTAEGVALHRDAFLRWVETAKPGELLPAPAPAAGGGE